MKVINNTVNFETWVESDPGVYPNAVAGYALPDEYGCDFSGEIVLEAENDSETADFENISDWFGDWVDSNDCPIIVPYGWSVDWSFAWNGNQVTVTPIGTEAKNDDYCEDY